MFYNILDEDRSGTVTYSEFVEQLYRMKTQDTQNMLLFIRGYINEVRQVVHEQSRLMNDELRPSMASQQKNVAELEKRLSFMCEEQRALSTEKAQEKKASEKNRLNMPKSIPMSPPCSGNAIDDLAVATSVELISQQIQDVLQNIQAQLALGLRNAELLTEIPIAAGSSVTVRPAPASGAHPQLPGNATPAASVCMMPPVVCPGSGTGTNSKPHHIINTRGPTPRNALRHGSS